VGSLPRRTAPEEATLAASASLMITAGDEPAPTPQIDHAALDPDTWVEPSAGQQARRWAGVLVAAGVLLAIATGVTVRSRDSGDPGSAAAPTVATTAPATTAPATTAPATTRAPASSVAPTTVPATTVPATTVPATTVPATSTVPAPTTTEAGPSLSDPERRAVGVTRALNDAIVRQDWDAVRTLAPANPATDETYERYWGNVEAATVVPARVAAVPGGRYDVFVGVVSVTRSNGAVTSALVCGRYTVELAGGTVTSVATRALREQSGTVDNAAVADELRDACRDPGR
jgi:hypothetical protein